jgi:hypothetical protein
MSTDDELLAALRDVLDADEPLREDVAEMIEHDAFASRRFDAALADLLYDTALETTAGVRGADDARSLSFAGAGHELDVELQPDATIVGRISPPNVALVVESESGQVPLETDGLGRFTTPASGGRLRFVIDATGPSPVVTPWIFR